MEHRVADLEELTNAEEEKEAVQEAGEPNDTDLDPIRDDPRFQAVIKSLEHVEAAERQG